MGIDKAYKATIYFTDGEPPITKHFASRKVGRIYVDGSDRIDWDSPLTQAHAFSREATTEGATVSMLNGVTMYIPVNRIKHVLVEPDENS